MKLYIKPGSCSLSPHIALAESGLAYETEKVDLKTKRTESGEDFLAINPKGYVPALRLDNGEVLTEGAAIVQYIADQVPERRLAPPNGSIERYRLQAWLSFIGSELHKSFVPFFNPSAGEDWKSYARETLQQRIDHVAQHLQGQDYLLGSDFSVADTYLFTVLRWARFAKVDLQPWPQLTEYLARVQARPAVAATLKAEGLA